MKNKRILLTILKFLNLRCKKKRIPEKDSIRPMKVTTIYPENYTTPKKHICLDGTVILYGFTNWPNYKEELNKRLKLERIPFSDAIDNSH